MLRVILFSLMVVGWAGVGLGEDAKGVDDGRVVRVKPRYYRWHVDVGEEWLEKNTGYARLDWEMPMSQVALVVVDVWDRHYIKDPQERAEVIIQEKIRPLMARCRESGLQIIHAPSPPQAKAWASWVGANKKAGAPAKVATRPAIDPAWPPTEFRRKSGAYKAYGRPSEPMAVDRARILKGICIHPDVEPKGSDVVVATGQELHEYCRDRGILFLVYIGFNTNMCILQRDYGAMDMHDRGYEVILLRDCTTGMESCDTTDGLWQTRGAVLFLEMNRRYSLLSEEFMAGLPE
jgi:nicotinamidase-related amidase